MAIPRSVLLKSLCNGSMLGFRILTSNLLTPDSSSPNLSTYTQLILVQKKARCKFFNKFFNKSIGSRSVRSTSSLPRALPPPLVEDLSTCSETSDDRSMLSETSEEVQVTLKYFLLDISEMTRQIISPASKTSPILLCRSIGMPMMDLPHYVSTP